jgi:hypothetical protein
MTAPNPSWLAYSVSNLVFMKSEKGHPMLLLGVRGQPAASIPEPGQYCLIGGFNTVLPWKATFSEVADAHMQAMLGLHPETWNTFRDLQFCEFPPEAGPLKIDGQDVSIKRMAVMRAIVINEGNVSRITARGKLSGVQLFDYRQYLQLMQSGQCSFPYQMEQVKDMFWRYGNSVD